MTVLKCNVISNNRSSLLTSICALDWLEDQIFRKNVVILSMTFYSDTYLHRDGFKLNRKIRRRESYNVLIGRLDLKSVVYLCVYVATCLLFTAKINKLSSILNKIRLRLSFWKKFNNLEFKRYLPFILLKATMASLKDLFSSTQSYIIVSSIKLCFTICTTIVLKIIFL